MKKNILLLLMIVFVSGCATKAQQGSGIGALTGALAGSHIGPDDDHIQNSLIGAGVGAAVGYFVGNEMDKKDIKQLSKTAEYNKTNSSTTWVNPNTNKKYQATPKQTYQQNNKICRNVKVLIEDKDGSVRKERVKMCRQPNGSWKFQ